MHRLGLFRVMLSRKKSKPYQYKTSPTAVEAVILITSIKL